MTKQSIEMKMLDLEKKLKESQQETFNVIKELKSYINKVSTTSQNAFYSLSESELSGRRFEIFDVIKCNPNIDRHELEDITDFSTGSISGRLTELLQSELIVVSSLHKGKFGKEIRCYSVMQEEVA